MTIEDILKAIREIANDARRVNNNQIEVKALRLHADLKEFLQNIPVPPSNLIIHSDGTVTLKEVKNES